MKPTMIQIAAFLKRYCPGLRSVPRTGLLWKIEWYFRDGRTATITENGRIVAVCLARCVESVDRARAEIYYHDEQAPLVWIEHIVSRHPRGIELLMANARERFGQREALAGDVFLRDGELRMLPWNLVERLATGVSHHVFAQHSRRTSAA